MAASSSATLSSSFEGFSAPSVVSSFGLAGALCVILAYSRALGWSVNLRSGLVFFASGVWVPGVLLSLSGEDLSAFFLLESAFCSDVFCGGDRAVTLDIPKAVLAPLSLPKAVDLVPFTLLNFFVFCSHT